MKKIDKKSKKSKQAFFGLDQESLKKFDEITKKKKEKDATKNMEMFKQLQKINDEQELKAEEDFEEEEEDEEEERIDSLDEERKINIKYLEDLLQQPKKVMEFLNRANENAYGMINSGQYKQAVLQLQEAIQTLEYLANKGMVIDRNMIVVILYNIACAYQGLWVLEKCSKYIDGVIFNIEKSLQEDAIEEQNNQNSSRIASKMRKLKFQLKVCLQYCAVLSQLIKHDEALQYAQKGSDIQKKIIQYSHQIAVQIKKRNNRKSYILVDQIIQENEETYDNSQRNSHNKSMLVKDEVRYQTVLLKSVKPVINELMKSTMDFEHQNSENLFQNTKRILYNWKKNPENNEKFLRKEFRYGQDNKVFVDNRSLLGIRQHPKWIENLNIGTIMHMNPITYEEYALQRDEIFDITKDALQHKIIFQSITYFTIATEMRFIEMEDDIQKSTDSNKNNIHVLKKSELYHLKAIELVCKYIPSPCPYVNHLITSYHKHYNQNLETIIEEESNLHTEISQPSQSIARNELLIDYLKIAGVNSPKTKIKKLNKQSSLSKIKQQAQIKQKYNKRKKPKTKINNLFQKKSPKFTKNPFEKYKKTANRQPLLNKQSQQKLKSFSPHTKIVNQLHNVISSRNLRYTQNTKVIRKKSRAFRKVFPNKSQKQIAKRSATAFSRQRMPYHINFNTPKFHFDSNNTSAWLNTSSERTSHLNKSMKNVKYLYQSLEKLKIRKSKKHTSSKKKVKVHKQKTGIEKSSSHRQLLAKQLINFTNKSNKRKQSQPRTKRKKDTNKFSNLINAINFPSKKQNMKRKKSSKIIKRSSSKKKRKRSSSKKNKRSSSKKKNKRYYSKKKPLYYQVPLKSNFQTKKLNKKKSQKGNLTLNSINKTFRSVQSRLNQKRKKKIKKPRYRPGSQRNNIFQRLKITDITRRISNRKANKYLNKSKKNSAIKNYPSYK